MTHKNIETFHVYNEEILSSRQNMLYKNLGTTNDLVTNESSRANLYGNENKIDGTVVGNSTNRFDLDKKTVYVTREDNIYIKSKGNLIINFNFEQNFTNLNELQLSAVNTSYNTKPIYTSGVYSDSGVKVFLEIFDTFRVYTITYN